MKSSRSSSNKPCSAIPINFNQLNRQQQFAYSLVDQFKTEQKQLLMIIIGEGGTGKSFVINAISHLLDPHHHGHVKRAAPTAKAAFLITGETCHRLLKIRPHKPFVDLTGSSLAQLEEDFRDTSHVIIDEFSMLSQEMLSMIDARLREATHVQKFFGGLSVILTGDLGQLPPVAAHTLYNTKLDTDHLTQGFEAYRQFNIIVRLDKLMRQEKDGNELQNKFIELLPRLRNGESTQEDWKVLMSRQTTPSNKDEFFDAVHLYPTNHEVDDHNVRRLTGLAKPITLIKAANDRGQHASSEDFGGLINDLYLCIGAQIVWLHNTWTAMGLTNGQLGVVKDIIYKKSFKAEPPIALVIHFPNYIGPQFFDDPEKKNWIPVSTVSFYCNFINATRTQFPVRLAYALTIHKCQGETLPRCVINIGSKECLGLAYVAFSRLVISS